MAKEKILVVDDEEAFRTMITTVLKKEGYETIETDNGLSAFELAKANIPDLIISDVMMYSGSGFILREFLKREPRTADIPLILMSGQAQSAGAWGADDLVDYLDKPFKTAELLDVVKKKLKTKKNPR